MERGRIQGLSKFFWVPLLSQERIKLRTSNFVGTFIWFIGTKAHENVGNIAPTIFRAPICRAHCAVIFAIAQLSCLLSHYSVYWHCTRPVMYGTGVCSKPRSPRYIIYRIPWVSLQTRNHLENANAQISTGRHLEFCQISHYTRKLVITSDSPISVVELLTLAKDILN